MRWVPIKRNRWWETPVHYRSQNIPIEDDANLVGGKLFDDPILYMWVTTALQNDKDLHLAASRVEEARASLGFTRADQFPQINIEGRRRNREFGRGFRYGSDQHQLLYLPHAELGNRFLGGVPEGPGGRQSRTPVLEIRLRNRPDRSDIGSGFYLLPPARLPHAPGNFQVHAQIEAGKPEYHPEKI